VYLKIDLHLDPFAHFVPGPSIQQDSRDAEVDRSAGMPIVLV
jgi:hypothetical protein